MTQAYPPFDIRSRAFPLLRAFFLTLLFGLNFFLPAQASPEFPEQPRALTIELEYTEYAWWLVRWTDDKAVCQISVEHAGWPTGREIFESCGEDVFELWFETSPCAESESGEAVEACPGLYLHQVSQETKVREVEIELPALEVWISVAGCTTMFDDSRCDELPALKFTGREPLPNEMVVDLEIILHAAQGARLSRCQGATCEVRLTPTGPDGILVEFWASSTFGDRSPTYSAQVRVVPAINAEGRARGWYVDVLSPMWRGAPLASCSEAWGVFPPIGGPPAWLTTPDSVQVLETDQPYEYLARALIENGAVDTSGCPHLGLSESGFPNACGMSEARPLVTLWQNRFNEMIFEIAESKGVPAYLLKNLFALESQFWPGLLNAMGEVGLGHLTEEGADTTLLWNRPFYTEFCPLILDASTCGKGYAHLKPENQAILRGALYARTDVRCASCPIGIDIRQVDLTVEVFAETLLANCQQVGRMLSNVTGEPPQAVARFEDLWRFTLVNYNAGPGCLANALKAVWKSGGELKWETLRDQLSPACSGAVAYVESIARDVTTSYQAAAE